MGQPAEGRTFGERLRHDRLAAGLTQEDLAERSALSVRAIGDLECGRTGRPRLSTLRQIAEALSQPGAARPLAGPPQELPAPALPFIGRETELATLTALHEQPVSHGPQTAVISAIDGTAGVGKTALALWWAHQRASLFPDGQLYVNLRGYDPDQPVRPHDALGGFLRALGLAGPDIPPDQAERAARYRSRLAGRRVLVLLDNARDAEQVRPLLPGSACCLALVTSRDTLAGLVARDGALRLDLDLLSAADAVSLLRSLIGERAESDRPAVEALAVACGGLPLALRIAAELVSARPLTTLADLAGELADRHRRLDLLDAGGDPQTAMRAVFSWSYQHLDGVSSHAFRQLGLHPGAHFDAYATAALTGGALEQASRTLAELARAHLIAPAADGRYGMHDLLRAYAAELAAAHDPEPARRAALTRLFDYYLGSTAIAVDTLFPAEEPRTARTVKPSTPVPQVTDPAVALDWLNAERAALVAIAGYSADYGWPDHTTSLARIIFRYLEGAGHYPEIVTIYAHARRAASLSGDRKAQAEALNCVCVADLRQGRYEQAAAHLRQARLIYAESSDRTGQAYVLGNLGIIEFLLGRYRSAIAHQHQALELYRLGGSRLGEARTLVNLAIAELRLGEYEPAAAALRRSLDLAGQLGIRTAAALALVNLGLVELRLGRPAQAIEHERHGLALYRESGDPAGEAEALTSLGAAESAQGWHHQAIPHHQQALALFRRLGDPAGQAAALNGLAEALLATGDLGQARGQHGMALALAGKIGDRYEQARAHLGLARCCQATDPAAGRGHWRQAMARYAELGAPEAGQLAAERLSLG